MRRYRVLDDIKYHALTEYKLFRLRQDIKHYYAAKLLLGIFCDSANKDYEKVERKWFK